MTKWNIDGHYHQVVLHDTWTHQPKKKQKNIEVQSTMLHGEQLNQSN